MYYLLKGLTFYLTLQSAANPKPKTEKSSKVYRDMEIGPKSCALKAGDNDTGMFEYAI